MDDELKVDDKVTVLVAWMHERVVHRGPARGYVTQLNEIGRMHVHTLSAVVPAGSRKVRVLWHNEGVTWIRGHHSNDSAEVRALLAAYALVQGG